MTLQGRADTKLRVMAGAVNKLIEFDAVPAAAPRLLIDLLLLLR